MSIEGPKEYFKGEAISYVNINACNLFELVPHIAMPNYLQEIAMFRKIYSCWFGTRQCNGSFKVGPNNPGLRSKILCSFNIELD